MTTSPSQCQVCGKRTRVNSRNYYHSSKNPNICVEHNHVVAQLGLEGAKKWYQEYLAVVKENRTRIR